MFIFVDSISGQRPVDCGDIGSGRSGVYAIYPKGSADPLKVFCFMQNDEAGWTYLQTVAKPLVMVNNSPNIASYH
jgi:hypothetical protein